MANKMPDNNHNTFFAQVYYDVRIIVDDFTTKVDNKLIQKNLEINSKADKKVIEVSNGLTDIVQFYTIVMDSYRQDLFH